MEHRITTKDCDRNYEAATAQNAIRLFFADVLNK